MRQIPQSRCSAAGEGSAAELLRGDARRQDLLLLDVHKTCTPMLTLLRSSVACVNVGAPAWDCLVVHFLAREFSGLELSFKLCGWQRKLLFNDVWEERGADKGGLFLNTRWCLMHVSAHTHTPRLMGAGLSPVRLPVNVYSPAGSPIFRCHILSPFTYAQDSAELKASPTARVKTPAAFACR